MSPQHIPPAAGFGFLFIAHYVQLICLALPIFETVSTSLSLAWNAWVASAGSYRVFINFIFTQWSSEVLTTKAEKLRLSDITIGKLRAWGPSVPRLLFLSSAPLALFLSSLQEISVLPKFAFCLSSFSLNLKVVLNPDFGALLGNDFDSQALVLQGCANPSSPFYLWHTHSSWVCVLITHTLHFLVGVLSAFWIVVTWFTWFPEPINAFGESLTFLSHR